MILLDVTRGSDGIAKLRLFAYAPKKIIVTEVPKFTIGNS